MKSNLSLFFFIVAGSGAHAVDINDYLPSEDYGKFYGDFRLRFENVEQDNPLENADALTLRSRLGFNSTEINGFSATIEIEDSRPSGIDDFTVGPTNYNPNQYSVIADPETTELDQLHVNYTAKGFSTRVGRQVITLDNHRFVGHVGFRQDRQTFDGIQLAYQFNDALSGSYYYVNQRNRIFADETDLDSDDHLLNIAYKTKFGKLSAYSYLLEVDNNTDNAIDTFGVRFAGKQKTEVLTFLYTLEFAQQDADRPTQSFSANYLLASAGVNFKGITSKLTLEQLGSDAGSYGFSTPLATLHKFNGWADVFLATPQVGLDDLAFSLSGKAFTGKWILAYHDFSAREGSIDDFGNEINASYTIKFAEHYTTGLKLASYSAGDAALGKVDTDKVWMWLSAAF